jgi:breast cancer 2 susceptibility protein
VHLKHERCELVTAKWVENHWALILWKIAGQIKARPTVGIFNDKWNWFEVICQLKYR